MDFEDGKTICICNPMYTGVSCDMKVDDDCLDKGDCATKCPPGKECACLSLNCGSNGMCVESYNGTDENVFCKCFGDYEGDRCDHIGPTGILYIYNIDDSTSSTQFFVSAVIGASTSIAVIGLVALIGIITLAVIWKIRKIKTSKLYKSNTTKHGQINCIQSFYLFSKRGGSK